MWHRVATNPKPEETDGLLDFGIDFLNSIPIQWSVLGMVRAARRHLLRRAQLAHPVARGARIGTAATRAESRRMTARRAARRGAARSLAPASLAVVRMGP